MKICMACSAGGHLAEILQLMPAVEKEDVFFVTYMHMNSTNLKYKKYFVSNVNKNPLDWVKNTVKSFFIMLKERPKLIITTGAGVAVPSCLFGKLFGSKIIYIEGFARVNSKSATSKFMYPFADIFLVQWKGLLKLYGKKAEYHGAVF
ncbi:MAG: capsular biosynthesis protein [Candidatus Aenigmarchaeota archaeon]|nr:capsular biosynthesis protein [Candidatus Aenigmarchaeota archaeon]